ncbi:MAG: vitamin K epoxide reductase family protein [Thermoplasmata archaeon]
MRTRDIRSVIYLAGGFGLIVAIYTYVETVEASLQKYCTLNAYVSCGAVANSGRTTLFGVPDSFIGIGGFVLILLIAGVAESRRQELLWPYLLLLITTAGVAVSLFFLYEELFEIHALCPVCLAAWVLGWVAWGGAIALVRKARAKARARAEPPEKTVTTPSSREASPPSHET